MSIVKDREYAFSIIKEAQESLEDTLARLNLLEKLAKEHNKNVEAGVVKIKRLLDDQFFLLDEMLDLAVKDFYHTLKD